MKDVGLVATLQREDLIQEDFEGLEHLGNGVRVEVDLVL